MAFSYCNSQTYGLNGGGTLTINVNKGQGFVSMFSKRQILEMFTYTDTVMCQVERITLYDVDGVTLIDSSHALNSVLRLTNEDLKFDTNFDTNGGLINLKTIQFKIKIRSKLDKRTAIK